MRKVSSGMVYYLYMDDASRWDLIHQKGIKENEWHSIYAEEKEKLFPRSALIVELGAGTGADAIYFLRKGHSVIAMDISMFALDVLKDRAKKENLLQNLIVKQIDFGLHQLPIKDNSVDIVYSRISLNYFDAAHTENVFKDIFRMLKTGGCSYLSMKSPDDLLEMEYLEKSATLFEPNVYIEGGMLRSRFTLNQLKQILTSSGISQFEVKPYKEDLEKKGEGHNVFLYVNDIYFKNDEFYIENNVSLKTEVNIIKIDFI